MIFVRSVVLEYNIVLNFNVSKICLGEIVTDSEKTLFKIAESGSGEDLTLWRSLNKKTGVNCKWLGGDEYTRGETPLLVALFNQDKTVFMGILRMGGDPSIEDSKGRCVIGILDDLKNIPEWVDEKVIDQVERYYDMYLDIHTTQTDAKIRTDIRGFD